MVEMSTNFVVIVDRLRVISELLDKTLVQFCAAEESGDPAHAAAAAALGAELMQAAKDMLAKTGQPEAVENAPVAVTAAASAAVQERAWVPITLDWFLENPRTMRHTVSFAGYNLSTELHVTGNESMANGRWRLSIWKSGAGKLVFQNDYLTNDLAFQAAEKWLAVALAVAPLENC